MVFVLMHQTLSNLTKYYVTKHIIADEICTAILPHTDLAPTKRQTITIRIYIVAIVNYTDL